MTNEQIIYLFASMSDDNKAETREQIILNSLGLVYNITNKYKKRFNYSDIVQDAVVGLIKAVDKFDHTRYPNFFKYASMWIRQSVSRGLEKVSDIKRVSYKNFLSIEENEPITEDFGEQIDLKQDVCSICNKLSTKDRYILEGFFGLNDHDKLSVEDMSEKLGISGEGVRLHKNRVIEKIATHFM